MAWSRAWVGPRDWAGSRWWKYQILASRPVVSDKGSGPLALQKRILRKTKSSETCEVFIRRKKSTVCVDRHTGRFKQTVSESHPCSSLNYFYGIFLPGFVWPGILICLVHSPHLVYLRILPCVRASLSQDGSYCKGSWVDYPLTWLSFHFQGAFSVRCGQGGFQTSEWDICGLCSLQLPPLIALLFLSLECQSIENDSPIA